MNKLSIMDILIINQVIHWLQSDSCKLFELSL